MTTTAGAALDSAIAKARTRLLPFLVLMYVLAFIDRANVGFAKNVLQADTGLSARRSRSARASSSSATPCSKCRAIC